MGAIHDSVTNDAGGGGGCRTRALQLSCKHPRLIVESLPSSTQPNRLDFKPTGKTFLGQIILWNVLGLKKLWFIAVLH